MAPQQLQNIIAKIKQLPEVWRQDKELVRLSHPKLGIDWNAQMPNQSDAYSILATKSQMWLNPAEPFELNERSLSDMLNIILPEVEKVFDVKLLTEPKFEILPQDRYLARINELQRETNALFGYGTLCQSPPTMYHFPSHGKVLMPAKYLVRAPKGSSRDITSADFDVIELEWDQPFFEEVLCEELSHVIFMQLRGE